MKRISTLLFCILIFFSCARKFSITSTFRKGIPDGMQQLVIDSSYHLYIREVFLDTSDAGDKMVLINNNNAGTGNKLIEIEYLLLSELQNRSVYIATIPDKYQTYYAKKIKYLKREYLNAYDFSTFRFGKKVTGDNVIVFENTITKHSDTWNYSIEKDSILHVYEVVERINGDASNVYLTDEALSRTASFIRTDSFRIAFRNMDKEKKVEKKRGRPPLQRFSKDNIIYYRRDGNKYTIYFRFNKTLPPRYKDSTISFGNTRLVNAPF
ncbi:hypothetical protein [Ferruginibacter sp. SUN106]|uniref:hypothetical protein n=1 Tax=Ferruginibacter sp. SUN106 TaxID=2978348 RepID=UPI003D35DABF